MELETAIENAFLGTCGRAWDPDRHIHPADEMYTWLSAVQVDPACRRLHYMRGGHDSLVLLEHVASCLGRPLAGCGNVLEFASGYGRFTRFLVHEVPAGSIWCSDVLPGAVEYVGRRFGVHPFLSATNPDDLRSDVRFGLIFVGSLFTHLPRHRFGPWLRRLYDLLTPEGVLVWSTHGPHECREADPDPSGYTFVRRSESSHHPPEEYGATWVAEDVVREIAAGVGVQGLRHAELDLWGSQDVYVVSAAGARALGDWTHTPRVHGAFIEARVDERGHGWVSGWTRTRGEDGPPAEVRLVVDGLPPAPALMGDPRVWGPRDAFLHTEWYTEGDVSMLSSGGHAMCALGRLASGRTNCFDAVPLVLS